MEVAGVDVSPPAPLPVVIGPTGSGKSELALRIAEEFRGEIVSCDSVQIYRGFDIGTAKLSVNLRRGVPHHLIDIADPSTLFTAGDYSRVARSALRDIAARGRAAIVAGGAGLYLRALLEGLFAGPPRDSSLRARLLSRERRRPGSLPRLLRRFDPSSAARIHPNDVNKTLRALEVRLLERQPLTKLFETGRDPLTGFRPIFLGLDPPRPELYRALDARTARMFEAGLVEEARSLLASGVPRDAPPFESLGYKQALAVSEGRQALSEALAEAQLETRRYAKRQMTWFRRQPGARWLHGFGAVPAIQRHAIDFLQNVWNPPHNN